MAKFNVGEIVEIQCEVQAGAFPTEVLVTLDTVEGPISGFVRKEAIKRVKGHEGYIRATVKDVSADTLTVVLQGSFFTTTGLAYLKRDWANAHVQPVAHAA